MKRRKTPNIGFKVASCWHPSEAHALGYAWLASSTLKDALERTVRYIRVVSDKDQMTLEETDEEFRLVIDNPVADYPTAAEDLDATFAVIVRLCRMCLGDTFLLGFSEPSNFSRAFRRWTGKSPSAYRAESPAFSE